MLYTLPEKVSQYIDQFTGRTWLLPKILDWFENSNERLLLITGDPGTGKSLVAAWLAGSGPLPEEPAPGLALPGDVLFNNLAPREQLRRLRGHVRAAHFCQADGDSIQPAELAKNLANQLTGTLPGFKEEIEALLSERVVFAPVLNIETVAEGGLAAGIYIKNLNLQDMDDQTRFTRSVSEPLRNLYKHSNPGPILIIVDSLDEALSYTGEVKIPNLLAKLSSLPAEVRFLAVTRPDPRVLKDFFQVRTHDLIDSAPPDAEDVRQYVSANLPDVIVEPQRSEMAQQISAASKGVFLYGRLVVEELREDQKKGRGQPNVVFPPGLPAYYNRFLERELGKNIDLWQKDYRPVLGLVCVGQGEGLLGTQVERVTRANVEKILLACLQYMDGTYPEGPFRVFHRSFADFLLESKENTYYHIDAAIMHAMIADYYYAFQNFPSPPSKWDDYALRYITVHLEGASRLKDEQARHTQVERLVKLVQDPMFLNRFRKKVFDDAQVEFIFLAAVRAAAGDTREEALELLLRAQRRLQTHRHEQLQPGPVFEMAEKGELDAAISQLVAFPLEAQWQRAATLVLAWLAAKTVPDQALAVLNRMENEDGRSEVEIRLGERLRAVLEGRPLMLYGLPPAPPREFVDQVLLRLGGQKMGEGMVGNIDGFELQPNPQMVAILGELAEPGSSDTVQVYLAQQDGPLLVAFATENLAEGLQVFQKYLDLQSANPYQYYRNASLWMLLDFVLLHPDPDWTLQALKSLFNTAYATEGMAFEGALQNILAALQARAGLAEARQVLDANFNHAQYQVQKLANKRYQSDTWGVHKRRMAALAQAYALLPDQQSVVKDLLNQAFYLPRGFAGFMYAAWLNLAETVRICGLEESFSIQTALRHALETAQNIQDSVFCARSTARVIAMMRLWWPLPAQNSLEEVLKKFVQQPHAPEFTAQHRIGEDFQMRDRHDPDKLPLHDKLLNGRTLRDLSDAFRLPIANFIAANAGKGWDADTPLWVGDWVNIPDPEFTALLAARLSAEVAVADWLYPDEKRALIQPLVVTASDDRTAMDTVLARLFLAAVPGDLAMLERLAPLAQQVYSQYPDITFGADG